MWFVIGIIMMLLAVMYNAGVFDSFIQSDLTVLAHWVFWIGFLLAFGLLIIFLFTIGVFAAIAARD